MIAANLIAIRDRARIGGVARIAALPALLLATLVVHAGAGPAQAQMVPEPPPLKQERAQNGFTDPGELPEEVQGVELEQNLEAPLPLDAAFTNESGERVTLGDYFDGELPVLVNFGYYECPALCPMVWQGMTQAFDQMGRTPGEDFIVVTISVSEDETPEHARAHKERWVGRLDDPETAAEGWHFLVGEADQIERVAKAVGFGYKPLPAQAGQFAHQAAITIVSPEGRVMRYMGGIQFPPRTLWLSLVDASEGKVGSLMDQAVLFCSAFDPESGHYQLAMGAMRIGGAATVVALIVAIMVMVKIGRRRRAAMSRDSWAMISADREQ